MDAEPLSEREFFDVLLQSVPVDVDFSSLSRSTRLCDLPQDKVSAGAIQTRLRALLREPPDELVDEVDTLGEAYDWYKQRVGAGPIAASNARVQLRPVREADLPLLYEAATRPEQGFRWRYRGTTPGFTQFAGELFDGVHSQFIVEDTSGRPHGLVCCYGAQSDARFAYLGFVRCGEMRGKGEVLEGMLQFIQFLFDGWDFRKLYAEVPEYNAKGMFAEESRAVRIEGRLRGHNFHGGKWWDQLIVALWREDWVQEASLWNSDSVRRPGRSHGGGKQPG